MGLSDLQIIAFTFYYILHSAQTLLYLLSTKRWYG